MATLPQAHLAYRLLPMPHAGKGGAVRAGVAAAIGDPIVFLDADLTIPVESIDMFIEALAGGADIAVASRYVKGAVVERPWWRVFMGVVFHTCVHLIVPVDVNDTQCGGKAYTAEAAKYLFRTSRLDGFAFDAEVIFLARREGYRVAELPVELRQRGETSIDFLADTLRMLRDLVLIRFNAATGRYERLRQPAPSPRPSLGPGE